MSAAPLVLPGLFAAGGAARLPSALRRPERRPLCVALFAFAIALAFDIPTIYSRFDRSVGVPNLADLLEHSFGIVGVYALLRALQGMWERGGIPSRRERALIVLPIAAIGASAGLFFAASPPVDATNFTDRYGHLPLIAAYWAITIGYFAVILAELASLVTRHGRRSRRPLLRLGLRLVGIGVGIGVAYSLLKIVELVLDATDSSARSAAERLDPVLLTAGVAVIGVGLLLPALETAWTAATTKIADRVALLRLRRLWSDITGWLPDVVLGDRPSLLADLFGADPSFRLYRRQVEIKDVQLAIRSGSLKCDHLPPADVALLTAPEYGEPTSRDLRGELAPLLRLADVWHWTRMSGVPSETRSRAGLDQLARIVSEVLGPMPLGVALCVGIGAATRGPAGAAWGLLAITFAAIIPYVVTWRMRHPGDGRRVSASSRLAYLAMTLGCAAIGLTLSAILGAPHRVIAVTITIIVGLLVGAAMNVRWRASNHVSAAGGAVAMLAVLYGPIFVLGYSVVALVAWSRVRLGRHTVPDVLLGAVTGSVVGAVVLTLVA